MAGRWMIQKFSSRMSRSRSLFGPRASSRSGTLATVPTSECGITTLSKAAARPGPTVPSNHEGAKTLTNVIHEAAVHPGTTVPSDSVIQGNSAMYLNTFPYFSAAAKTTRATTSMPIHMKAAGSSVKVVKQTFSSSASTGHEISGEARTAASQDGTNVLGWDEKFTRKQKWLWGFAAVSSILGYIFDELRPSKHNGISSSGRCPSCGKQ